jgi:hypothetical protein
MRNLLLFLLVAVMIGLGIIGGGLFGGTLGRVGGGPWQRWASPPENIAKILTDWIEKGDFNVNTANGEIYVGAASGTLYACDRHDCRKMSAQQVHQPRLDNCHLFEPPGAPGEVVVSLELCEHGSEFGVQTDIIALKEGSLWMWFRASTLSEGFGEIGGAIVGGIVGLIIVIVIVFILHRSKGEKT